MPSSVELECFIKYYNPKGWRGTIHEFDFAPLISEDEFKLILNGQIPKGRQYDKWYVHDAIKSWMDKEEIKHE